MQPTQAQIQEMLDDYYEDQYLSIIEDYDDSFFAEVLGEGE